MFMAKPSILHSKWDVLKAHVDELLECRCLLSEMVIFVYCRIKNVFNDRMKVCKRLAKTFVLTSYWDGSILLTVKGGL